MRKHQAERLLILVAMLIILALSIGGKIINNSLNIRELDNLVFWLFTIIIILLVILICSVLLEHKIYKGFKYFFNHLLTVNKLEKQMIDAGFSIQRSYYIETPKITLDFSGDFLSGTMKINNVLKFDTKLDDVVLSCGLGKYIVERHYQSDDANYYIYELVDGSLSYKQIFESYDEFLSFSKEIPTYKLFLDSRSIVKLQHTLLVGQTGSGKTYSLYSLLLQMLNKDIEYKLYYADPKGSSLAVLGEMLASDRTAVDMDAIIKLLEEFVSLMQQRKKELKKLLQHKIDADYSDFGLSPCVFLIDEYASFASVLQSQDKKIRDKVKALLYEIILQGRQLGCFLFLIMQKSDATLLDTALRDNIPLKIVLGNSEQQTYVTTFGAGADIPNRHYKVGEGVFTEPVLAPEPKLVQFPYCKFDILQAIQELPLCNNGSSRKT